MQSFEDMAVAEGFKSEAPDISMAPPYTGGEFRNGWTDEENALVFFFRVVNRAMCRGPLSAIERAFVSGAKTTLESLAHECTKLLDESQHMSVELRDAAQKPESAADLPLRSGKVTTPRKRSSRSK